MTLFPTHLSLESILFWSFISSNERDNFRQNKSLFWIVIMFSILPDIDIFFALHRLISHSIFVPIIITIIGTLIYYYYHYLKVNSSNEEALTDDIKKNNEKKSFWGRCLSYGGILWFLHILLDLDSPLAIFYPLSNRLYSLNFAILIDMMPWVFLPVTIVGFILELTGISYLQGVSLYFINLSPSQRIEIYGREPVAISIDNLLIHVLLFIIFFIFVARPMLPNLNIKRFSEWRQKNHFDSPLIGLGIMLILLGFLLGPMTGMYTVDSNSVSGHFRVSSTSFFPTLAISFESTDYLLQPSTLYNTEGTLSISSEVSSFDHMLLLTTQSKYNSFSGSVSTLFKLYPLNTSDNILKFQLDYQTFFNELSSSSLSSNSTTTNETSLYQQLNSGSYALVAVIHNLNLNVTEILNGSSLTESAQLEVMVVSSQFSLVSIGIISFITGIILIFVSFKIKKD